MALRWERVGSQVSNQIESSQPELLSSVLSQAHIECGPCGLNDTFPQMFPFVCRALSNQHRRVVVKTRQESHTLVKVKIITFKHHFGNGESHDIKYMLVDYWMGY